MSVSKAGQQFLDLIGKGIDTEDALERATHKDPEDVARALAALARRGLIKRRFSEGEMRYHILCP